MNSPPPKIVPRMNNNQIKSPEISISQNIDTNAIKERTKKQNYNFSQNTNTTFARTVPSKFKNSSSKNNKDLPKMNNGVNVNIILSVTQRSNKRINKEDEKIPRTSPYDFKYFCNTANKKSISKALSVGNPYKNEKKEMESNFMKLSKDANIYTSNAEYITNKKLLLFDKYDFENNNYKPNRANLFDMTNIPHSQSKNNTVYKTTRFRGGKMFFYDNNNTAMVNDKKTNNNVLIKKKPLYMQDLEKLEIRTENEFYDRNKNIKYFDDTFQSHKRHPPSNSLYKELMTKKNEIYDNFVSNKITDVEKITYPLFKSASPSSSSSPKLVEEKPAAKKVIKNDDLTGYVNLLNKKKNDNALPITYPLIISNNINCDSISQRNRFQNIMETFVKLKILIENDRQLGKNNEADYIIEFILNKQIDKKYIKYEYITNFCNFLNCEKMPIDTNKSLKDNIILALNYKAPEKKYAHKPKNYSTSNLIEDKKIKIKDKEDKIPEEIYPLEYDLNRQTKLYSKEIYNSDYELRDALKKELDSIEDEIQNKQTKIKQVEDKLNLIPFEENYYYKQNINKNSKLNKNENKELLLISHQGYYKAIIPFNEKIKKENKKNRNNDILFDSNERLYYTWYKSKNIGDIANYKKKSKLTEYIIYNRTKDKILKNQLKEIADKKHFNSVEK